MDTRTMHGEPHHLNAYVLDQDSSATGYGRHHRLVGPFLGTGDESHLVTLREDIIPGRDYPFMSDESDRRRVLHGPGRMHPRGARLTPVDSVEYVKPNGETAIEHTYKIERR